MVNVDDGRLGCDPLDSGARSREVSGVEEDHQVRVDSVRGFPLDIIEAGQERIHVRQRRRNEHPDLLPRRTQRLGERQAAAKGVAVCVLVPEDQDLLVGVDELLDLVVKVWLGARAGYFVSSLVSSMEVTSAGSDPGGRTSLSSAAM